MPIKRNIYLRCSDFYQYLNFISNNIRNGNIPTNKAKFLFLLSNRNIFEVIQNWKPRSYTLDFIKKEEEFFVIYVERHIKRTGRNVKGYFIIKRIRNENFYILFTLEKQEFIDLVMIDLFESYYSNVSRLFINSYEIQSIIKYIQKSMKGEIIVKELIAHKNIKSKEKDFEITRTYTDKPYQEAFNEAFSEERWIDKIAFMVHSKNNEFNNFRAYISRETLIKCNDNITQFIQLIIRKLVKIYKSNQKIFDKRSRRENNGEINPIAIKYKERVFKGTIYNKEVINVISNFPKSSYTIYHGNPYLHISLVDYLDGSSYEIWISDEDKLTIIPQIKATFNSLSRLCEHITREFLEGNLIEV